MKRWSLIFTSMAVTYALYAAAKQIEPARDYTHVVVQLSGLWGIMCLAWSFDLSTKSRIVERWFGGLDQVYKVHHIVGGMALVLLLQHASFLLIRALPQNLIPLYLIPGLRLDYTLGQLALYWMLFLLILTFYIPLLYRYWKWSHEWLGLVIIMGGLHSILVESDVANYVPLQIWIAGWSLLGTLAYLYKRFAYYGMSQKAKYGVIEMNVEGPLLIMTLKAVRDVLDFAPGQYGFFALKNRPRDEHAFSILSQVGDELTIGVKVMRNFTKQLSALATGSELIIRGPYGMFAEKMQSATHVVFIAGGIGITPFRSMLRKLRADQQAEMYFCAKVMPPTSLTQPFADFANEHTNFRYLACETSSQGRITAEQIFVQTGRDKEAYYFLCGPREMMEAIASDLAKLKIKRSHIIYEDFGFK